MPGDFRYSPKMKDYPALQNIDIEGTHSANYPVVVLVSTL